MELSAADYYKQLSTAEVAKLLGVGKTTVWKYVKTGVIPKPRYPLPKTPKWKLGEIIETYEQHLEKTSPASEEKPKGRPKKIIQGDKGSLASKLKERFGIS